MNVDSELRDIRERLLSKPYSRFKILGESPGFHRFYNEAKSFEDNAVHISSVCIKRYRDFNTATFHDSKRLFRGLKTKERDKLILEIAQSIGQAGKNISGQVFQRQLAFLLQKATGCKVSVNSKRNDLTIHGKKDITISAKLSVRDRSNDNTKAVKIVYGMVSNGTGGFTREGFENWSADNADKILVVINPTAREQVRAYAARIGVNITLLSLDQGIAELKKLL